MFLKLIKSSNETTIHYVFGLVTFPRTTIFPPTNSTDHISPETISLNTNLSENTFFRELHFSKSNFHESHFPEFHFSKSHVKNKIKFVISMISNFTIRVVCAFLVFEHFLYDRFHFKHFPIDCFPVSQLLCRTFS
jgi:hypothetical protein